MGANALARDAAGGAGGHQEDDCLGLAVVLALSVMLAPLAAQAQAPPPSIPWPRNS